jgi:hypothetical protein
MRYFLPILFGLFPLLPACQQARQVGQSLSAGSSYVSRPVVSGTKKVADATLAGSRKMAEATTSGSKKIADATVAGSRKLASATASGAKSLAAGATRLITFGSANRPPAPAPLTPAARKDQEPGLPAAHQFPTSGLLVTESELGPEATRLEATAVTLAGGWTLNGSNIAYHLEPGADDPAALRITGSPATAKLSTGETTASAREIHYHSGNQVLTLRGDASLASAISRVTATAPSTLIKIHLPTGAISIAGPARWGESP